MTGLHMIDWKHVCYQAGKLLFLAAAVVTGIVHKFGTAWMELLPPCLFHEVTGMFCPGCGGTRAVMALAEMNLIKSFFFHPVVLYAAFAYIWFMLSCFLEQRGRRLKIGFPAIKCLYIGIAVIIVQFLAKNICLLALDISWL